MILWAFEYIAHVGLFFPLQMLVLKSRKYQISDSDYTLLKQLCLGCHNVDTLTFQYRFNIFSTLSGGAPKAPK